MVKEASVVKVREHEVELLEAFRQPGRTGATA